jgi:hypothetical protein
MELWQLDVTGSVFLADGTECKLISGIDDHSRFCVIATAVRRATGPFASVEDAQAAVDVWREEYNHRRPHQSLDMACPAGRFRPTPADDGLELWAPPDLEPVTAPAASTPDHPVTVEPVQWPDAIEIDRVVPPSGNLAIGPQQFWLGPSRTGQQVRFWIDTITVHLSIDGWRIKTVPSRLSAIDIARLRQAGASPAGPPPAGPAPGALAATSCVEVQRLVNSSGIITLANQVISIGSPLAGQRARIRLDGQVMHVITQDGLLWRTLPCPIPASQRHKLQGVRLAGPKPLPSASLVIQRKVSSRGGIRVARQHIQVGLPHAGRIVTIEPGQTTQRQTTHRSGTGQTGRTGRTGLLDMAATRQPPARPPARPRGRGPRGQQGLVRAGGSAAVAAGPRQSAPTPSGHHGGRWPHRAGFIAPDR